MARSITTIIASGGQRPTDWCAVRGNSIEQLADDGPGIDVSTRSYDFECYGCLHVERLVPVAPKLADYHCKEAFSIFEIFQRRYL